LISDAKLVFGTSWEQCPAKIRKMCCIAHRSDQGNLHEYAAENEQCEVS